MVFSRVKGHTAADWFLSGGVEKAGSVLPSRLLDAMKESLKPYQRIRQKDLFRTILNRGVRVRGAHMQMWVCDRAGVVGAVGQHQRPMLGIIVGRKTDRSAAGRNLWKRRIREAFRRQQRFIGAGKLIVIRSGIGQPAPSYVVIAEEIKTLFIQSGERKHAG